MCRKSLTWQLLAGYLGVMLLPLLVASWYTSTLYKKHYMDGIVDAERTHGYLMGEELRRMLVARDYEAVDLHCKKFSSEIGMRVTVVLPDGRVVGDSEKNPDSMENHIYRSEISAALTSGFGTSERFSTTLREPMVYVASLISSNGEASGVVRTAVPVASINSALREYYGRITMVGLVMALIAVVLSVLLARRFIRPVRELERGAQRFASGQLSARIALPEIDELRHLGVALNEMASQLQDRIQTITAQRNEREAILAGMSEGVIAIDTSEHIISVNASAAETFGIDREAAAGCLLGEVIRNSALQKFSSELFSDARPLEKDIVLPASGKEPLRDRFLQIHGTVLRDADGALSGILLVASDVTRLRELETIRKEFVANVSHELRTPLTAIKGFVETLQGGALDSREDAARFVNIIAEQVERLAALIDDLLTLAVIEKEEEGDGPLFVEDLRVAELLGASVKDFSARAEEKGISVSVSCGENLSLRVNGALMQQAIGNLIDNAVKYSDPGTRIEVGAAASADSMEITVRDQGIGIPQEHIERVFERFYRVDKARSRKQGGTGLGLSIVKHVVQLHGGRVSVESVEGKGSVFTIRIPL